MPRPHSRPLGTWIEPAHLFRSGPARATHAFWLDAADGTGWSLLGTGEPVSVDLDALGCATAPAPPLDGGYDGPFRGGWIGWLGYDRAAARAGAAAEPHDAMPPDLWLRASQFVAFDHARRRVWLIAEASQLDAFEAQVREWCRAEPLAERPAPPTREARARHTPAAYAELIDACRAAIRAGDAYQLCLTTRFEVDGADLDPADAYLRLRASQPSAHGLFIRSGPYALVGSSPEQFLRADGGSLRTRPIKGTRPRDAQERRDAALAEELAGSVKERAENVMIVDLMRNDLQQVCQTGTVITERLLEVESHPAVHQLVSTVAGRLSPGTTVGDVLRATFPAGSMTGAPKLSAMDILHTLEGGPRGVYAGCAGWVGADGDLELTMVIRSIGFAPGVATVGAGGGITWLSEPGPEVAEVGIKACGPLRALGAPLPAGW